MPNPSELIVRDDSGISYSLPPRLDCISTYVLLEQEHWFEREVSFIGRLLQPEMTVIDIGANVGVYALPSARCVGPEGRVFAYEPAKENIGHLSRTILLNGATNIVIRPLALSDRPGMGRLSLGRSGETHRLADTSEIVGCHETVEVTTLDEELERNRWQRIDFIKLDAEGAEVSILSGSQKLFCQFSPIVLFEINHASVIDSGLRSTFRRMGFELFRLLGDGSELVPFGDKDQVDHYELNLFAIRPPGIRELADRGLLAQKSSFLELSADERERCAAAYCGLPFSRALGVSESDLAACPFGDAMLWYAAYRFLDPIDLDRRLGFIEAAFASLVSHCTSSNSPSALASLVRIALDLGHREIAVSALQHLLDTNPTELDEPFFPVASRFEQFSAVYPSQWFMYSLEETLETASGYSSLFRRDEARLARLASHPFASAEMIRRLIQGRLFRGIQPSDEELSLHASASQDLGQHARWRASIGQLAGVN
mgnify:FL=1